MRCFKICLLMLCVMFAFTAEAKKDKNAAEEYKCEEKSEKMYCSDENGIPLSGKYTTFYSNKKTKSIENYKNGYRDGLSTFFTPKGAQAERTYYKQGVKNGMSKIYYPNRTIKFSANYADGLLDGRFEIYSLKGNLLGRFKYKNGSLVKGYCVNDKNKKNLTANEISAHPFNTIITCGVE